MIHVLTALLAQQPELDFLQSRGLIYLAIIGVLAVILLVLVVVFFTYGKLWFRAYMSSADVSIWSIFATSVAVAGSKREPQNVE